MWKEELKHLREELDRQKEVQDSDLPKRLKLIANISPIEAQLGFFPELLSR